MRLVSDSARRSSSSVCGAGSARRSAIRSTSARASSAASSQQIRAAVARRLAIGRPDRLEQALGVCGVLLAGALPADEAARAVAAVADDRPLARQWLILAYRDLDRASRRAARVPCEVCEHERHLGRAPELAPAALGRHGSGAPRWKAPEQQQVLRAAQELSSSIAWLSATRPRLGRTLTCRSGRSVGRPANTDLGRRRDRPAPARSRALTDRPASRRRSTCRTSSIALAVAAVAARQPLRLREPVALLPGPQRGLADTGAIDDVPDRRPSASASCGALSRTFSRPSRTRLFAVPSGTPTTCAISRAVSSFATASSTGLALRRGQPVENRARAEPSRSIASLGGARARGRLRAGHREQPCGRGSRADWLRHRSTARLRATIVT